MPHRDFSRGRCDAAPQFFKRRGLMPRRDFSGGQRNTLIALLQFFKRPAQYHNCRTTIFIWPARYYNCHSAIFIGRRDTTIATSQILLAGVILRLPRRDFLKWPA
jgi:hypothetical protein